MANEVRKGVDDPGRYFGFRGHFDSGVFVFDTCEERDRWQIQQYGHVRNAWREPDAPFDARPLILHEPVYRDADEQVAYERAVAEIRPDAHFHAPRPAVNDSDEEAQRVDGEAWLGMQVLCDEIVSLATGMDPGAALKRPPRRISQREWASRQRDVKMRAAGDDWREAR